jgi:alpha-tubulin suppressor-like RCC1 family protein
LRRKPTILGLTLGLSLATTILVLLFMPRDPLQRYLARGPNPSPVTVAIGSNKGQVRVFPGFTGCFIIPPDGSLWRWGQPGGYQFSRTNLAEQVGTNRDWAQASAANGNCVGVTADGSFWSWGLDFGAPLVSSTFFKNWDSEPKQVGIKRDWAWATSGGSHAVMLKRDGTVWGWGHDSEGQLGNGLGPEETNLVRVLHSQLPHIRTNLVQVGTNGDWTAVSAEPSYTLALRADGTLWMWGKIQRLLNGQPGGVFPVPTRVCRETNWSALQWDGTGLQGMALDGNGGLWRFFNSQPEPSAGADSVGQLFASNCVPGRFALAYPGFWQLHPDGTLWETKVDFSQPPNFKVLNQWHRAGKRSDWIGLWGGMGTAYGVTADGTVWTWGTVWGLEGITSPTSKMHILENRIKGALGFAAKPYSTGGVTPIQREPRPLIIFQSSPSQ